MSARRPVIGIVGSGHVVPRFWGELPVTATPTTYVEKVVEAGGRPVILPGPVAGDLLDHVDGLVLTGGGDVDPRRYGGPAQGAIEVGAERDDAEIALVQLARQQRIPLLGVCRGLQILVVASGGTLRGDLAMSHVQPETGHPVEVTPGSLVADLLGSRPVVSSLHHQAVAEPGPHWRPTAWADDGIIEAAEWIGPEPWPVLGVQWHPELEAGTGAALFDWLVRQAIEIRGRSRVDGEARRSRPHHHPADGSEIAAPSVRRSWVE